MLHAATVTVICITISDIKNILSLYIKDEILLFSKYSTFITPRMHSDHVCLYEYGIARVSHSVSHADRTEVVT